MVEKVKATGALAPEKNSFSPKTIDTTSPTSSALEKLEALYDIPAFHAR